MYLIGLGLWTLFSRHADAEVALGGERRLRRVFAQGVLVNVLNPKIALFFLAFLPQFVDPMPLIRRCRSRSSGLLFVALALVLDLALGPGRRYRGRPPASLSPLSRVPSAT